MNKLSYTLFHCCFCYCYFSCLFDDDDHNHDYDDFVVAALIVFRSIRSYCKCKFHTQAQSFGWMSKFTSLYVCECYFVWDRECLCLSATDIPYRMHVKTGMCVKKKPQYSDRKLATILKKWPDFWGICLSLFIFPTLNLNWLELVYNCNFFYCSALENGLYLS